MPCICGCCIVPADWHAVHRWLRQRRNAWITETNRIQVVLFGTLFGPYLAAINRLLISLVCLQTEHAGREMEHPSAAGHSDAGSEPSLSIGQLVARPVVDRHVGEVPAHQPLGGLGGQRVDRAAVPGTQRKAPGSTGDRATGSGAPDQPEAWIPPGR
jgi:hypothetical protein